MKHCPECGSEDMAELCLMRELPDGDHDEEPVDRGELARFVGRHRYECCDCEAVFNEALPEPPAAYYESLRQQVHEDIDRDGG